MEEIWPLRFIKPNISYDWKNMDENLLNRSPISKPALSIWQTILIGWLTVNVPALSIMFAFVVFGIKILPNLWLLFLASGCVVGWTWWSFTVPRWRRWAHEKGIDRDKLHRVALLTGLVWPKGSFLEKTEFKIKG